MGCLCILYYLVLAFYSRRLRSTFAAFWLISGGVHLVLGCAPLPVYVYKALGWFCLGCWILFLFIEFKIIRGMCAQCDEELDWIIVLGAQVRGRYITNSLRRRLDCALAYAQRFPRVKVIVSGGQGPEKLSQKHRRWQSIWKKMGYQKSRFLKRTSPPRPGKISDSAVSMLMQSMTKWGS